MPLTAPEQLADSLHRITTAGGTHRGDSGDGDQPRSVPVLIAGGGPVGLTA